MRQGYARMYLSSRMVLPSEHHVGHFAPRGGILHQGEHFVPGVEHFVPCKTFFRYKTPCVMHFVPPKTFSQYQIGKFDSFGGKRGAFLPQILNSANTHRDTIQVLQRQEQELRTRIAKHLSGQVRAPGASLIIGYGCKHGCRWRSVPARSGASQFALWASADDRHDTLSCFD